MRYFVTNCNDREAIVVATFSVTVLQLEASERAIPFRSTGDRFAKWPEVGVSLLILEETGDEDRSDRSTV